jgi:hypothetical protein
MDRTCPKCGKVFDRPVLLQRHADRKTPCTPILDSAEQAAIYGQGAMADPDLNRKRCRFCGRVFASYDTMRRHVRTSCRIAPNSRNGDVGMELLYEHTIRRQQAQIDLQRRQIDEMLALVQRQAAPTNINNSNVAVQGDANQIDNRHQNIVINIFGSERLDHIDAARIRSALDEARHVTLPEAANCAIIQAAMLVFSDPDHPENLTAYLPNARRRNVLVHGRGGWEIQPASIVLSRMALRSIDVLFAHQPYENAEDYGELLRAIRDNEKRFAAGASMEPILVRNRQLLHDVLQTLPLSGCRANLPEPDDMPDAPALAPTPAPARAPALAPAPAPAPAPALARA